MFRRALSNSRSTAVFRSSSSFIDFKFNHRAKKTQCPQRKESKWHSVHEGKHNGAQRRPQKALPLPILEAIAWHHCPENSDDRTPAASTSVSSMIKKKE